MARLFAMAKTRLAIVMGGAIIFAGCSSSSDGGGSADLSVFCHKTASCGVKDIAGQTSDQQECEIELAGWMLPPGCAQAVVSASCSDFTYPFPNLSASIEAVCAPQCSAIEHPPTCNGDQLTRCDSADGMRTFDCASFCSGIGKTYAGTCGTSYDGQTRSQPSCWCK